LTKILSVCKASVFLFNIYSFENCIVLDKLFHIYASSLIMRYMVFFV
jgi:hypothetical protein